MLKIGTDCSGIGAPEQALIDLGVDFKTVFACEKDKWAQRSYLANHKCETMFDDITTRSHIGIEQLDIYVAGFPCQPFSHLGDREGFSHIEGTVFFNCADFIKENQPKAFILENVKGLISHDKGNTFKTIINLLAATVNGQEIIPIYKDNLGYHLYFKVLDTVEHGIPQRRQRIFIVGFKDRVSFRFPDKEPLKLKLSDLLEKNPDEKYFMSQKAFDYITKPFRIKKGYTQINGDIALALKAKGQSNWTGDFVVLGYTRSSTTGEVTSRHVIEQANTLHASSGKGGNTDQFVLDVEKKRIRKLTPTECLRLQGFPDTFRKVVSDSQLYKQIGNSMSVPVIRKILSNVIKSITP